MRDRHRRGSHGSLLQLRPLVVVACLVVLIGPVRVVAAQADSPPVSFPRVLTGDLAAMVPLAEDLPVEGLAFSRGELNSMEREAASVAEALEMDAAEVAGALDEAGWRGRFVARYRMTEDADPDLSSVQATASVTEYADANGAADGFALLEAETNENAEDIDAPDVGDASELTRIDETQDLRDEGYLELDYSFRTGNLVANLAFRWYEGQEDAALSEEEMADAAQAFLERIEAVPDAEEANLFGRILRVDSTDEAEIFLHGEDYEYMDGSALITIADDPEAVAYNEDFWEGGGAERVYYVEAYFGMIADEGATTGSYIARTYSFATAREARDFVAYSQADFIDIRRDPVYSEVTPFNDLPDIGEEIAGASYVFPLSDDEALEGYRIWVQQGNFVGSIELDTTEGVDPELIFGLIEAQARCLDRDRYCRPVEIPEGIFG